MDNNRDTGVNGLRVGQRVVCVRTWVSDNGYWAVKMVGPVRRQVYTIRATQVHHPRYPNETSHHVLLEEIVNPTLLFMDEMFEPSFDRSRFRPLIVKSQEEDAELFKLIASQAEDSLVSKVDELNRRSRLAACGGEEVVE